MLGSPMAAASSPARSDALEIRGCVTPGPVRRGGLGSRPRPQKLFPEQAIELPNVLQHPGYKPTSARSGCRTQPTTPSYTPLIVRSMVVTPRIPSRQRCMSSRLRSISAHHAHTRQKSAMGYASIVHSLSCYPKTEALSSSLWSTSTPACMSACDQTTVADHTVADVNRWDRSGSVTMLTGNLLTRQSCGGKEERTDIKDGTDAAIQPNFQEGKNNGRTNELGSNGNGIGEQFSNTGRRASDKTDLPIAEDGALDVLIAEGSDENLKKPSCRRNLAKELERELTFRPELNQRSLKIASHSTRQCVPLVCRLTERRKKTEHSSYSFAPRINPHSVKLAQERAGKIDEVRARIAQQAAKTTAEMHSKYTFKPQVSEKSLRIAETLGTSFEKRQEIHMERRKKAVDASLDQPQVKVQHLRPRRPPLADYSSHDMNLELSPKGDQTSSPMSTTIPVPRLSSHCSIAESTPLSATPPMTDSDDRASDCAMESSTPKKAQTSPREGCKNASPAILLNSHIKTGHRKRLYSTEPSSKGKCKIPKRRKSVAVAGECGSPPKREEEEEVEGINFSTLRTERERVRYIKKVAGKKVKENKLFLIHGGYRIVRNCLRNRGWVELEYQKNKTTAETKPPKKGSGPKGGRRGKVKAEKGYSSGDDDDSDVDLDLGVAEEVYDDEEEYSMVTRVVRNSSPNFVWTLAREAALYDSLSKSTITNHFAKASSFTTKSDLCTNLRNLLWHGDRNPDVFFPRCYCLGTEEERDEFVDDYRFTAAVSILKILSHRHSLGITSHRSASRNSAGQHSSSSVGDGAGEEEQQDTVPERAVRLALKAGEAYLSSKYHDDIENSELHLCPRVRKSEWEEVVEYFYKIRAGCHVQYSPELIRSINSLLSQIKDMAPQFNLDGDRNIWIVKPGASSRGRGIMCLTHLNDIFNVTLGNAGVARKVGRYVVQKYIERPLLIYETKFDIRQWFLVTDWNPLTMWMYQECYVRFSSQPYTLDSMDV